MWMRGSFIVVLVGAMLIACVVPIQSAYDVEQPVPGTVLQVEFRSVDPISWAPQEYRYTISNACGIYDVPPEIVARLLWIESRFNPKAVGGPNRDGTVDYGIAQINSAYLDDFKWRYKMPHLDPFNADDSIWFAVKHLRVLFEQTGNWWLAVASYNAGLNAVLSGNIPQSSAQYADYVIGISS